MLTEATIKNLQRTNLQTMEISLDGLGETHDEFRGVPGAFQTIVHNIKNVQQAAFLQHLQIVTTVHKKNIKELEKIYEFLIALGIKFRKIGAIDPVGRAKDNGELLLNGEEMEWLLNFVKTKRKEKKIGVTRNSQGYLGLEYEMEVRKSCFNCLSGINIACILYNGDIFGCYTVPRIPHLIQGNVRKDNFAEVRNTKFKEFRTMDRLENPTCKACSERDVCK